MKKTLLVSSFCVLLAGGGLKPASIPVSAQTPFLLAQTNNSTQTAPAVQTNVELLNPGAEPRQEMRFTPAVNSKQTLTITTNMDMSASLAGQPMPKFKIPASVMKMEAVVTQVDPNGDIHSQFAYTDADVVADPAVPPELLNAMQSAIKQIVGLKGSFVTDNRGQIKSGNFDLPEGGDPVTQQLFEQMSNSLDQFSSPVPAEAVGKGARWRVSSSLNLGGINVSQNITYELVDLQENVATLNVIMEQQADSQELNLPGMPAGASLTLKSLNSEGEGQIVMRLDGAMPMRSNLAIRSKNQMNIKEPGSGQETTLESNLAMQMTFESQIQP